MKQRLAKKIVKASPLYQWKCKAFGGKPCCNKYWLQKWKIRRIAAISLRRVKSDYRILIASRKMGYVISVNPAEH